MTEVLLIFTLSLMSCDQLEDTSSIEICEPGVYPGACAEIHVSSLVISTVLKSANINDMEGASGIAASFDAPQSSLGDMMGGKSVGSDLSMFDESAQCMASFRILKSLVHKWLILVSHHEDENADIQVGVSCSAAYTYELSLYTSIDGSRTQHHCCTTQLCCVW